MENSRIYNRRGRTKKYNLEKYREVECYYCGRMGHIKPNCLELAEQRKNNRNGKRNDKKGKRTEIQTELKPTDINGTEIMSTDETQTDEGQTEAETYDEEEIKRRIIENYLNYRKISEAITNGNTIIRFIFEEGENKGKCWTIQTLHRTRKSEVVLVKSSLGEFYIDRNQRSETIRYLKEDSIMMGLYY